ncbi:hypothetical protein EDD53_0392 [Pacificibacter maritimus]|uniref:Uncharacterized protein n=1 Tax=Pacificibacter maritimus TaxID=762213 RepID=A0A3N4UKU8_9RHOB|nr:hypothetical protein [Pacificibacter maritimus]RPE71276.1 hypothetical protein EDD53_0392 [Pacificibacter maritimus]
MTVLFEDRTTGVERLSLNYSTVKSCAWGYVVQLQNTMVSRSLMRMEVILFCLGFGVLCLVVGLWVFPGSNYSPSVIGLKTALSIVLGIFAMSVIDLARRGLRRELQVDMKRNQIRSVWRNKSNATTLQTVLEFEEINSIFIRRRKMPLDSAVLNVRYGHKGAILEVAAGQEVAMRELWEALNMDLLDAMPGVNLSSTPKGQALHKDTVKSHGFTPVQTAMPRRSAFSSSSSSRLFP